MQKGMETHRTILSYIIEWFLQKIKNDIVTFLGQFLSKLIGRDSFRDQPVYTGGLQFLQAPMPSFMASRMVSARRLDWVPQISVAW